MAEADGHCFIPDAYGLPACPCSPSPAGEPAAARPALLIDGAAAPRAAERAAHSGFIPDSAVYQDRPPQPVLIDGRVAPAVATLAQPLLSAGPVLGVFAAG
jgi:hypothetical protein